MNQLELITKELQNASHHISDKMQVTIILTSLPLSWEHIVKTLTHSGKEISMVSLPNLLVLEEEKMKTRWACGRTSNKFPSSTTTNKIQEVTKEVQALKEGKKSVLQVFKVLTL